MALPEKWAQWGPSLWNAHPKALLGQERPSAGRNVPLLVWGGGQA